MAAKKGLIEQAKDAIAGVFESKPARKSPKRVAAGKKAARTRKVGEAVKAVKKTAKKAATAVKKAVQRTPAKKTARKTVARKTAARKPALKKAA